MRAYDEGIELANSGNNAEAVKKFQEATSDDPNFALAYSMLAQADASLGRDDEAEQASRRAVELSKNLSTQERYLIEASHTRIMSDRAKIAAYGSFTTGQNQASGMHFSLIDWILWLAAPVLQIGLLVAIYKRGLYRDHPLFTIYLLFQVLLVLFLVVVRAHPATYYYGYWCAAALDILISCAVICEILNAVFRRDGARRKRAVMFGTLAFLLLILGTYVVAAVRQVQHEPFNARFILTGILLGDRGLRLLQCALVVPLFVFSKRLGISLRQLVFGIALGFSFFAAVNELVHFGLLHRTSINLLVLPRINNAAYLTACLIWLAYTTKAPIWSGTLWADRRSSERLIAR